MNKYNMVRIREHEEWVRRAAEWFHHKWGIPLEAYLESMQESIHKSTGLCLNGISDVPEWYIVLDGENIIAGIGVIENDFHNRKDLTPNVCAVYVEEAYRCQGIAGEMLKTVCDDFAEKGVYTLYLLTDHTSFYERYGWEFLCMVQGDGEEEMARMYVHRACVQNNAHAENNACVDNNACEGK